MKKTGKIRKIIACALIIIMALQVAGCSAGSEAAGKGTADFIAEALPLPHECIIKEAVWQNTLYYLHYQPPADRTAEERTLYRLDLSREGAVPEAIPFSVAAEENIIAFTVDGEGKLHLIVFQYEVKGENAVLTDVNWVKLADDGTVAASHSLSEGFTAAEEPYVFDVAIDEAGNACLAYTDIAGSENGVLVADPSGRVTGTIPCEGSVSTLCRDENGKVYAFWHDIGGSLTMAEIDGGANKLGDGQDIGWLGSITGAGQGPDHKLLLASEKGVYTYDVAEKTHTEQFQWTALDLAMDNDEKALPLADGRILWVGKKFGDNGIIASFSLIRPRREDDREQADKTVLTFGGIPAFIEGSIKAAIVDFNRSSENYRIEIREYGADGDVAAGMERLNADIAGGNCPDILALPLQFSMKLYADKGVLTDLNPYLEQDSTLKRVDLQENILKAYEVEGKLYGMPISYMVQTLMGRKARLEGRHAWNLAEMTAFADSLAGESMFLDASKSSVLRLCLLANGGEIISRNGPARGFNRELFLEILEFSNRFIDDSQFSYDDDEKMFGRIDGEQVQLQESSISDFTVNRIFQAQYGEPGAFVGYPAESGSGALALSAAVIAVSSKCAEKEAAWQLIGSMLTEEFQAGSLLGGFPIRKSGLERQIEAAMEASYRTDENGNRQEVPKGGVGMGTFYTELYAATEEEVRAVRELIDSVDQIIDYDDSVMGIISEEAPAYFGGGKTAAEVADIVENRVGLYLDETEG